MSAPPSLADRRAQLDLLARELDREAHILQREPQVLASHLHNMLILDEGDDGPAATLLLRARHALGGRPWLRLVNRPSVPGRGALLRILDQGAGVTDACWRPRGAATVESVRSRQHPLGHSEVVAVANAEGRVRLWDAGTGQALANLDLRGGKISTLAWSPNGRWLAAGDSGGVVCVWSPLTGETRTLPVQIESVTSLAWGTDAGTVVVGSADGIVRLWNTRGGNEPLVVSEHRRQFRKRPDFEGNDWQQDVQRMIFEDLVGEVSGGRGSEELGIATSHAALAWHPSYKYLATAGEDRRIQVLESDSWRTIKTLDGHTNMVTVLVWSPDGRLLASRGVDAIRIWDVMSAQPVAHLTPAAHLTPGVGTWSPDGAHFAFATGDTVRFWNSAKEEIAALTLDHTGAVMCLAFSPDGHNLAVGDTYGVAYVWDPLSGHPNQVLPAHADSITATTWSSDGRVLGTGSQDGTFRLWDVHYRSADDTRETWPLACEMHYLSKSHGVTWSPDEKTLASGGNDDTIRLWNSYGRCTGQISVEELKSLSLTWTPDGQALVSGGLWPARVWHLQSARLAPAESTKAPHRLDIDVMRELQSALACSPDGTRLAEGDGKGVVCVSHLGEDEFLAVSEERGVWVRVLAWSPDGRFVAAGGDSQSVWLFDPSTEESQTLTQHPREQKFKGTFAGAVLELDEPTDSVLALAWAPDSARLAAGGDGGGIVVWDLGRGFESTLAGHTRRVRALTWSPDGRLLASAGDDQRVRMWDLKSSHLLMTAYCVAPPCALQFSSDGRILRAADKGSATGNRPLPYMFEVTNLVTGEG